MQIPEGVATITAEGRDLASALTTAAQELGVEPTHVGHKLDLSHFRSGVGTSVARTTVKIIAWASEEPTSAPVNRAARPARNEEEDAPRPPRRERKTEDRRENREERSEGRERREGRDRRNRERNDKPVESRAPEATTTEASDYAQDWFNALLKLMSVEGSVSATGNDERVHLQVQAERAGRIIGKRGATLGAVRHLLGMAIEQRFGELTIDVDVEDPRGERDRERPADRDEGRQRRRRRKGDSGGRPSEKGRYPEAKLQALAERAAEKARETGQTITINLELNSYDRRVVHVAISEIDGVDSQSEEREVETDGRQRTVKYVQVIPAD